jgi:hypothetical protein
VSTRARPVPLRLACSLGGAFRLVRDALAGRLRADVVRTEARPARLMATRRAFLSGKRRIAANPRAARRSPSPRTCWSRTARRARRAAGRPLALRRAKPALVITCSHRSGIARGGWRASNLVAHAAGGILSPTGVVSRAAQNGGNQA